MTLSPLSAAEQERVAAEFAAQVMEGILNPNISACEDCHKVAELRPYGIDGANVCFGCGMKDEENAKAMFFKGLGLDYPAEVPE